MTKAHTPAPWKVCEDYINVYAPETDTAITNQDHICAPDQDEAEANARLIAAAPCLLEALEKALWMIESNEGTSDENDAIVDACRAAIAKAKGGAE